MSNILQHIKPAKPKPFRELLKTTTLSIPQEDEIKQLILHWIQPKIVTAMDRFDTTATEIYNGLIHEVYP